MLLQIRLSTHGDTTATHRPMARYFTMLVLVWLYALVKGNMMENIDTQDGLLTLDVIKKRRETY